MPPLPALHLPLPLQTVHLLDPAHSRLLRHRIIICILLPLLLLAPIASIFSAEPAAHCPASMQPGQVRAACHSSIRTAHCRTVLPARDPVQQAARGKAVVPTHCAAVECSRYPAAPAADIASNVSADWSATAQSHHSPIVSA